MAYKIVPEKVIKVMIDFKDGGKINVASGNCPICPVCDRVPDWWNPAGENGESRCSGCGCIIGKLGTSEQYKKQKHLEDLVKRCRSFVRNNSLLQHLRTESHLSSLTKREYKGQGLIILCEESAGLADDGVCDITVQKKGFRRFEFKARAGLSNGSNELTNVVVSTYRRGDWEKKIPKRMRP